MKNPDKHSINQLNLKIDEIHNLLEVDYQSEVSRNKNHTKLNRSDQLRTLIMIILDMSTIMPFKWYLNRYRCFYCDSTFAECTKLKQHTKEVHQDIKLKTVLKGIGTNSRIKWDISEISCKKCPKPILSLDGFLDHVFDAHDINFNKEVISNNFYVFNLSDTTMRCVECGEIFQFFNPLLRHVNKYHIKTKPFICDYCSQSFAIKGTLKSHIINVHRWIPHKCKICNKLFPTKQKLTNHYNALHQTGKCPLCPEILRSRYLKKRHLAVVHKLNRFPCDLCSTIYTDKSKLTRHKSRVHSKEKTATCHICGYEAFTAILKKHILSHDPGLIFRCDICNKMFKWKKSLNVHKKKHV